MVRIAMSNSRLWLFQTALRSRLGRAPVAHGRSGVTGAGRTATVGRSITGADRVMVGAGRAGAALAARPRGDAGGSGGGAMGLPAGGGPVATAAFARLNTAVSPACCDSAKSRGITSGEPMVVESEVAW